MSLENAFGTDFRLVDSDLLAELEAEAKIVTLKRGEKLIESGELQENLPILIEGVFRGYLSDEEGKDITDCFACNRGDIVMGCDALGEPSRITLEAVVPSTVLMLPVELVMEMMERSPEMLRLYNACLVNALRRHWELKMLLLRCSAMERYRWFIRSFPGLVDVVSNKNVSSFLGMTPVTLSRLRHQMRMEGTLPLPEGGELPASEAETGPVEKEAT